MESPLFLGKPGKENQKDWFCYFHIPRDEKGKFGTHICSIWFKDPNTGEEFLREGVECKDEPDYLEVPSYLDASLLTQEFKELQVPAEHDNHSKFSQRNPKHDQRTKNIMKQYGKGR